LEVDEVQFYFFASIGRLIFFVGCRIGGIPITKALLEIPRASAAAFVAASVGHRSRYNRVPQRVSR
jgi:hypothetical protein